MELRKLDKQDIKAVAELAVKVMTPQFKKVGEEFLTPEQYAEKLKDAMETMEFGAVIEENKKIVGFAHWYYDENQAFIEDLVVEGNQEKLGRALAVFILQNCKNDKIESATFLAPYGSEMQSLMEKFAFKPISVELKRKL